MKKLLLLPGCLLACVFAFSTPAFASSGHYKHHAKHHHQKIHNGTPNHRRAGT